MADTPKENEAKYKRFLTALKTLAPTKTFSGITLADFVAQCVKSDAPRDAIIQIDDQRLQEEANRDTTDITTMKMCETVKNGVIADPEFGDDSALYEALGFVRKSERKSGLTRKKTEPEKNVT